ncbi:Ribosomal RNA small subunit methyltransferase I OS=Tsukamurella paurometabola (strain ATCC 8368 /DSM / CCUG 35730 / CIP 100753 / JCM 10117 / KCTC 9821/ NBRC 16120 / NCIMB 702349 / NCTC 13040) OX=521096 GN=rsmI PE=3 SV=1 [Tsukamurella paurometabola]|uniref:Ribosomal RNA small subunit methyltransferase I n=1 Tax=Tsukamurella paurometabola (strain ATCC 8368 / DSM 20162 / CCUG 35730 / CIP 100753 / JCM 10117 / KCTC 9821 / NBRC 16120 / NCIMB 702349 / NCTC 13040) TaxID=521096 RepID=D5UVP3_TSUPD|nr:16S rRNA (cytidine(1402)-2'-O)-methyltransferase [Tsukamurella paurometabola]ADG79825.1 Uroporphyrin-III C/tetrapyrrole (Corrin/Porphyrin) methyltransferase [Tsukamurella paurometabola DSM 20162]SUP37347.1 Ribosomal RNA small subunit methyltransferase I [Tsukamurella paurometabola]
MGSPEVQGGAGVLVVAGVPMGNPGDATARLIAALGEADIVAAEDTRRARTLAAALGVELRGRVLSFYDHNEQGRIPQLLDEIAGGARVLLITDAGMPSVSDPGYRLVAAAVDAGHPVTCLPGPSAVTTALALSGLPVERFCFDGFAPRKPGARRSWLSELVTERRACVFFESPHRIAETLADAAEVLGADRRAAVCRELTKTYEEVRRGGLGELAAWAADGVRGEITVVIAGAAPASTDPANHVAEVLRRVAAGERLKDACAAVAAQIGASRRDLYQAALAAR